MILATEIPNGRSIPNRVLRRQRLGQEIAHSARAQPDQRVKESGPGRGKERAKEGLKSRTICCPLFLS